MKLVNLFTKVAFAQILLGILTCAVALGSPALVIAGGTMGMLSWYVVEGPGGRPMPRWMINAGVILATIWMLGSQMMPDRPHMIVALGQFILFILLFKLYERKTNRDWAQLMVLSLMQMICALILSATFLFGLLVVAYMLLTLLAVMLFQLKVSYEEVVQANERQTPPGQRPVEPQPVTSRGHRRHFNTFVGVCGISCLAASTLIFLLLPRGAGVGILGNWQLPHNNLRSGLSDSIQLGHSGLLQQSRTPVLNLEVRDSQGQSVSAEDDAVRYLRGVALDDYKSREWKRGSFYKSMESIQQKDVKTMDLLRNPNALTPNHRVLQQTITVRSLSKGMLPALRAPVYVQSNDIGDIHFSPRDFVLTTDDNPSSGAIYTVRSIVDSAALTEAYGEPAKIHAPDLWKKYARGDVLTNETEKQQLRSRALEAIAGRGFPDRDPEAQSTTYDHEIAAALQEFLQRAPYSYTLDLPVVPPDADPIITFLYRTRTGHCEYFASALCGMARSLGLRARVVIGFLVTEYNSLGNYYVIRQKNAHAWVEVWEDGEGWKVFDPSPPSSIRDLHAPAGGWLTKPLRDIYEYVEYRWIDKVITYNASDRRSVTQTINEFSSISERLKDLKQTFADFAEYIRTKWRWGGPIYALLVLTLALFITAILWIISLIVKRRKAIAQLQLENVSRRMQRRLAKHLEFYLTMLKILERAGFIKPVWQTPQSFAEAVEAENRQRFSAVLPLTQLFYEIRFGGRPLDTDRRTQIQQHLESLRSAVTTPQAGGS